MCTSIFKNPFLYVFSCTCILIYNNLYVFSVSKYTNIDTRYTMILCIVYKALNYLHENKINVYAIKMLSWERVLIWEQQVFMRAYHKNIACKHMALMRAFPGNYLFKCKWASLYVTGPRAFKQLLFVELSSIWTNNLIKQFDQTFNV